MPGVPAARRRNFNTRGRGGGMTPRRRAFEEMGSMSEPPKKKRRYVPGGPGGGGRYVDADGNETPVGGTGPGGFNYTGSRGRVEAQNAERGVSPIHERPERPQRPRRESRRQTQQVTRPRYSSAAAAAAAVVQGDGFKPREERGWEEFHEHLDIDAKLPVFSSGVVDGIIKKDTLDTSAGDMGGSLEAPESFATEMNGSQEALTPQPMKRRPGRPPRNPNAMLKGIGNPDTPKTIPLPGHNPREKLTLPKPVFRMVDPFTSYEKANGSIDYVDRTMANVGYQESDHFIRPEKGLIRLIDTGLEEELDVVLSKEGEPSGTTDVPRVEYDMDEQDQKWLETYNAWRKEEQAEAIKPAIFEITITKIEKEWHALERRIPKPNPKPPQTHRPRSSSAAAVNGEPTGQGEEQDSKCAICDDGDCENTNAIVFCDGCDLAVHQECYGVPFIPEGQWLCRKCHLTGRGTPTCVFCPNTDGAFKQTNSARWAHLLCAIWIPEVSLGNTTFMEPVMDVEKVPKGRWKLTCDICKQKMGACIQCSYKHCYTAFHVSCARRARWYLSMKSSHGGPANLDSNMLRAYCGSHVPKDWRSTYNTDKATVAAKKYYKRTMRGKIWADSQQTAATLQAAQPSEPMAAIDEETGPKLTLTLGANKKKKPGQPGKPVWRLPSGAPVVPAKLYNAVETSLQRFAVRKRREFAADMCRYWTLKREAKRGAALIKRLQLQMETFSSMEITRRNFAGMGAIGLVRLQRRIDFSQDRIAEVENLLQLCKLLKEREHLKLQDAEILRDLVNITYFPIPPLLWPILEKAQQ
jgi:NuA3 HAT complex component NTO1